MKTLGVSLAALLIGLGAQSAAANCCQKCGCTQGVKKVCRAVCETKKVKKIVWGCDSKDVCLPGPIQRTKVKSCCEPCAQCCGDPCGASCCKPKCPKTVCETPQCGRVRTVKKLKMKEIEVQVPTYKWVIEYICDSCASGKSCCGASAVAPAPCCGGASATPAPATNLKPVPKPPKPTPKASATKVVVPPVAMMSE